MDLEAARADSLEGCTCRKALRRSEPEAFHDGHVVSNDSELLRWPFLQTLASKGKKFRLEGLPDSCPFRDLKTSLGQYVDWAARAAASDLNHRRKLEEWAEAVEAKCYANWQAKASKEELVPEGFAGLTKQIARGAKTSCSCTMTGPPTASLRVKSGINARWPRTLRIRPSSRRSLPPGRRWWNGWPSSTETGGSQPAPASYTTTASGSPQRASSGTSPGPASAGTPQQRRAPLRPTAVAQKGLPGSPCTTSTRPSSSSSRWSRGHSGRRMRSGSAPKASRPSGGSKAWRRSCARSGRLQGDPRRGPGDGGLHDHDHVHRLHLRLHHRTDHESAREAWAFVKATQVPVGIDPTTEPTLTPGGWAWDGSGRSLDDLRALVTVCRGEQLHVQRGPHPAPNPGHADGPAPGAAAGQSWLLSGGAGPHVLHHAELRSTAVARYIDDIVRPTTMPLPSSPRTRDGLQSRRLGRLRGLPGRPRLRRDAQEWG